VEGEFDGIGVESVFRKTQCCNEYDIGGPSEKIGLMAGDRIIKVNDSIVAVWELPTIK
jgi:carboxyl-terminal processing protease